MKFLKKLNLCFFIISVLITLFLNSIIICAVAFLFEKEAPIFQESATLVEILKNGNDNIELDDFCLLNWDGSVKNKQLASTLPDKIVKTNFYRVSRPKAVFVQLLQNRFNSIIQIFSTEMYNEQNASAAGHVEFVKIGGTYYVIVGYTIKLNEKLEYMTAVFETCSDLSAIESFETSKPRFNSYHFYPLSLSPLVTTIFGKILNMLFVIGEISVLYIILDKRKQERK